MVIFVSKNSQSHTLDSVYWKDEIEIQDFVLKNSEIIFSEFLDDNVKICPIGRELHNGNGKADLIFLDQNGLLYIVETKLDSNSDKRQVFAQVTGYASATTNQCIHQSFGNFVNDCEQSIRYKLGFSGTFDEYLKQKFEIDQNSVKDIKNKLKNNIEEQFIFCIIVMDTIENSLKRDIDYYLKHNIKMCGIEIQKYLELDTSFFVPRYYGIEKLFLNEKNTPRWYKEHTEGWHFFNKEIQANKKLDENTKNNILKLTNSLENIPNSQGWMNNANKKLGIYFKKFGDYDYVALKIIYENAKLSFHLDTFRDDPKLAQEFKNNLSKIVGQSIENRSVFQVSPALWIPKVDEFISLFENFYS